MRCNRIASLFLLTAIAASLPAAASPPLPETPAPANELILARNFTMVNDFPYTWRAERPAVRRGTVFVVRVDPALIRPRQTAEPVLFAGRQTAWRVSPYNDAGIVVAFVPGRFDPSSDPVWFGTPDLPERIDTAAVGRETVLAEAAGIRPFGPGAVENALEAGGGEIELAGRGELLQILHELVLLYVGENPGGRTSLE